VVDYDSAEDKLRRAEKHLGEFEGILGSFIQAQPVFFSSQPNPDGTSEDFYATRVVGKPFGLDSSLGDCLHNFRCALDHVASAMSVAAGADPYDRDLGFPICDHPDKFYGKPKGGGRPNGPLKSTGWYKIRHLSQAAQAFIERLQPYNGGNKPWVLTHLQYLDNRDKHFSLLPMAVEPLALLSVPQGVTIEWASPLRLQQGAHVATVKYDPSFTGAKVKPGITAGVAVEHPNRLGFIEVQPFLRNDVLPLVTAILSDAKTHFS